MCNYQLVEAVTRSSLEWEVWGSTLGPVKSNAVLLTARHRCDIFSKEDLLYGLNYAEMSPAKSFHSEYNKRFDI